PAQPLAAGPGPRLRLGTTHRTVRRRPRSSDHSRPRRRDRRPGDRRVFLLIGVPGAPGRRVRHSLPTGPVGGAVPSGPGPGARRRRPVLRVVTTMTVNEFPLPDLGEGLLEAEIIKWLVDEGDTVTQNQPIVEVETAKAAVEIPAKWPGRIVRIFHPEGATVQVGSPIVAIDTAPTAGAGSDGAQTTPAVGAPPQAPKASSDTERTPVLVGYGPRTAAVTRRPRKTTPPAQP